MRHVLLLAYDGGDFRGWQRQPGMRTVQGVIEETLAQVGIDTSVQCASRTDAGVHALAQVAHFRWDPPLPDGFEATLARALPPDLRLRALRPAPPRFHARWSARGKIYTYLIALPEYADRVADDPFLRTRCWTLPDPRSFPEPPPDGLDLAAMQGAARSLRGRHDLRGLATLKRPVRDRRKTTRTLATLRLRARPYSGEAGGVLIALTVSGDAFLKHQVRNLVGLITQVGHGQVAAEAARTLVAARGRHEGPRAPGRGLLLQRVRYPLALQPFRQGAR